MTNEEMIAKLKLTPAQLTAFKKFSKALSEFEKAGGRLVGSNCSQYALNGYNYEDAVDAYESKPDDMSNAIRIDQADLDYVKLQDPFNDAPPYIIVRR